MQESQASDGTVSVGVSLMLRRPAYDVVGEIDRNQLRKIWVSVLEARGHHTDVPPQFVFVPERGGHFTESSPQFMVSLNFWKTISVWRPELI